MEIIERAKSMLVSPQKEWQTIGAENAPHVKVFTTICIYAQIRQKDAGSRAPSEIICYRE
jgi:hypothetical protein